MQVESSKNISYYYGAVIPCGPRILWIPKKIRICEFLFEMYLISRLVIIQNKTKETYSYLESEPDSSWLVFI